MNVSVVIAVRDGDRYLGAAIASVLAQTAAPAELLVCDDGSTDGSAALASSYGERVRVLRGPPAGVAAAINRGVERASGDVLAFLDADDLWTPRALELRVAALESDPGAAIAYGRTEEFVSPDLSPAEAAVLRPAPPFAGRLRGAMVVRGPAWRAVGPVREDVAVGEFVDWLARAQDLGLAAACVPEVVLLRRLHASNMTRERRRDRAGYARVVRDALDRRRGVPRARR